MRKKKKVKGSQKKLLPTHNGASLFLTSVSHSAERGRHGFAQEETEEQLIFTAH